MMKSESETQQLIQIESPNWYCNLMRNNSGCFKDETGRLVRFGLDNTSTKRNELIKSSDLIGIKSIKITQEMVGQIVGVFTAIEVKKENWKRSKTDKKEEAQATFIEFIKAKGGIAGFCKNVDEFKKLMKK